MKAFSWSLDRVLSLREFREKEAELALGKSISERDRVQANLEGNARKRVGASKSRKSGMAVEELLSVEHYIRRLDTEREGLLEELTAAELEVERRRVKYVEASRERNVLTRLREKKEGEWRKKFLAEEAAALDDIASSHDRVLKSESSRGSR